MIRIREDERLDQGCASHETERSIPHHLKRIFMDQVSEDSQGSERDQRRRRSKPPISMDPEENIDSI